MDWIKLVGDFVLQIGKWIIDNITTIKEILWIFFTAIATTVTILTYKRAKHTVLQPLKTEITKRQTDVLVQLHDYLLDKDNDFFSKVDYLGIVACNSYMILKEYGFVLNDDTIGKEVEKNRNGCLILKKHGTLAQVSLPNLLEQKKDKQDIDEEINDYYKNKYENAKNGVVEIDHIHLTNEYHECIHTLRSFENNAFIPKSIKVLIEELNEEIHSNLTNIMKLTLEEYLIQICSDEMDPTTEDPVLINHFAVYNNFQRRSNHHNQTIAKIQNQTRKYLKIDEMW